MTIDMSTQVVYLMQNVITWTGRVIVILAPVVIWGIAFTVAYKLLKYIGASLLSGAGKGEMVTPADNIKKHPKSKGSMKMGSGGSSEAFSYAEERRKNAHRGQSLDDFISSDAKLAKRQNLLDETYDRQIKHNAHDKSLSVDEFKLRTDRLISAKRRNKL